MSILLSWLLTDALAQELNIDILQGIRQDQNTFLNGEGYSILIHKSKRSYSPKSIKKLKKKFDIKKETKGESNSRITKSNVEYINKNSQNNLKVFERSLIYQTRTGKANLIKLVTTVSRDTLFEQGVLELITDGSLPKRIFNNAVVDTIRFINRFVKLGPECVWQDVGNIQCPYRGQMDWSVFTNELRAREYIHQRYQVTQQKNISEVELRDSVDVVFEDVPMKALRTKMKIKVPKVVLGGSNELTIYYVLAKIEETYAAVVMSHYSNDMMVDGLPPLLNEVMKLKKSR